MLGGPRECGRALAQPERGGDARRLLVHRAVEQRRDARAGGERAGRLGEARPIEVIGDQTRRPLRVLRRARVRGGLGGRERRAGGVLGCRSAARHEQRERGEAGLAPLQVRVLLGLALLELRGERRGGRDAARGTRSRTDAGERTLDSGGRRKGNPSRHIVAQQLGPTLRFRPCSLPTRRPICARACSAPSVRAAPAAPSCWTSSRIAASSFSVRLWCARQAMLSCSAGTRMSCWSSSLTAISIWPDVDRLCTRFSYCTVPSPS